MTESAFTVHDIYILYTCTHISYQQRSQNWVVFRITATYKALKIQYLWNLEEEKAVIQVFEISHVGNLVRAIRSIRKDKRDLLLSPFQVSWKHVSTPKSFIPFL